MNIDIVRRLRQHALPDPHDDREVLHAPLLREAADEIEALRHSLRLDEELIGMVQQIISRLNNRPMPNDLGNRLAATGRREGENC